MLLMVCAGSLHAQTGGGEHSGQFDPSTIDTKEAVVTFTKGTGRYAFDEWKDDYEGIYTIAGKYENIDGYYVPCKLIPPGRTDKVAFDLKKIRFEKAQPVRYRERSIISKKYRNKRSGEKLGIMLYCMKNMRGESNNLLRERIITIRLTNI
jgi:hypothetical protein